MPTAADHAVAAVAATVDTPTDGKLVAYALADSVLWSVHIEDSEGRSFAGGGWLVGPDARVFQLSSNPSIHDWDLAKRLLDAIYRKGVEKAVDPDVFADRLRRLTKDRERLVKAVLAEANAGTLRVVRRSLP